MVNLRGAESLETDKNDKNNVLNVFRYFPFYSKKKKEANAHSGMVDLAIVVRPPATCLCPIIAGSCDITVHPIIAWKVCLRMKVKTR